MEKIAVRKIGEQLHVFTPYHPDFRRRAPRLGGKFDSGSWRFDPRDEERVRKALRDVYGTDGEDSVPLVTVRQSFSSEHEHAGEIWVYGRRIASRRFRDDEVSLGNDVVILEGEFSARGGSAKYPCIFDGDEKVIMEVRNVPLSLTSKLPDDAMIVGHDSPIAIRKLNDIKEIEKGIELARSELQLLEQSRLDLLADLKDVAGAPQKRTKYSVLVKIPLSIRIQVPEAGSEIEAARVAAERAENILLDAYGAGPLSKWAEVLPDVVYIEYQEEGVFEMLVDTLDKNGEVMEDLSVWVNSDFDIV